MYPSLTGRLVLTPRLRTFQLEGRDYAHTSAVPLSYLAVSPALLQLLQEFRQPRCLPELVGTQLSAADEKFFTMLHRVGVLLDAELPDPVHNLRPLDPGRFTLLLFPTNSCNLQCIYCHATAGQLPGLSLTVAQAVMAVDSFFSRLDDRVRAVKLSFHGGGEPTMNFEVMKAAWERFRDSARQRGIAAKVQTITNGTFDPAVLRTLCEPEWEIIVSYDGPCQQRQRPTVTGRDSRAMVVANLRALRAAGKIISTRATLTRAGVVQLRALVDDAAEVGINHVQVEVSSTLGRGGDLADGSADPAEFAAAFLDAFGYALRRGIRLSTSAWTHNRIGDGFYCGGLRGLYALTPDGFLSACTEVGDGTATGNPFIVGRSGPSGLQEIWPEREAVLRRRSGYELPHCRDCHLVDTCAGGCPSKASSKSGGLAVRDELHCVMSRQINRRIMADLADGRLLPDAGWQPMTAELVAAASALPGLSGRLVALVPPFARSRWNAAPERRPAFVIPRQTPCFFHLPADISQCATEGP